MTLKQKTLIVTMAGIAAILLSGFAQFWTGRQIDSAWEQLTTQASPREKLLTDIKHQFGYGGIIHNFKNYVLRGQSKYIGRIITNGDKMLADIKDYKKLDLTQEEVKALDAIKSVMGKYTNFLPTVKKMWKDGATPAEIDKVVKISDGPAFKGFKILTSHFSAIAESANNNMDTASMLQFILLVSTFLLLSGVIIFAVLIQRSQTATIDSLSRTMKDIEQSRNFSRRIHDGRTDEMGVLTSTFDKLLADIESMLALNRAVLDAVPDPIFLEKDGKVSFGNIGAAEYAGVHIKDLQGMDESKVLIRANNQSSSNDYITCLKDGKEVILDEIIKNVTDKQGEDLGRLVVARDVTLIIKREAEAEANLKMIRNVGIEISNAAQELVGATDSLNSRIQTISQGAQTQQERTSETAAGMEEMNSTVLEVARNASGAAELAEQTRGKAVEGAEVVTQAIGAISSVSERANTLKESMGNLENHTESIGAIIGVINDIADQTNLLALNAAIEAARAGEAGRGFAVVADEVRKLAEKTMIATKDVSEAIDAIQSVARENIKGMDSAVEAVDEATDMAGQSGEALKAIVQLVEGTTQQVHSIATAAEEQSASSEKIKDTIIEVNTISNQTAEGMRESTNAIKDLSDLAQRLEELATKAG